MEPVISHLSIIWKNYVFEILFSICLTTSGFAQSPEVAFNESHSFWYSIPTGDWLALIPHKNHQLKAKLISVIMEPKSNDSNTIIKNFLKNKNEIYCLIRGFDSIKQGSVFKPWAGNNSSNRYYKPGTRKSEYVDVLQEDEMLVFRYTDKKSKTSDDIFQSYTLKISELAIKWVGDMNNDGLPEFIIEQSSSYDGGGEIGIHLIFSNPQPPYYEVISATFNTD